MLKLDVASGDGVEEVDHAAIDVHREVVQNPRRSINGLRPYPRHARDGSRTFPEDQGVRGPLASNAGVKRWR